MKQVQFENQLAINSSLTLKDIRNLILATRLIIQDQAINDLKTTLPRLGTFKKKLRAAKQKYNINTATVNTISAKNSLYMTRAGFQQQLLEPRYHESYTYKPDRIYPDSELCHLLSTLTNLELKTCKEFVYQFVSTVINTVIEGESVTIRNLGSFTLRTLSFRPVGTDSPTTPFNKVLHSDFYNAYFVYGQIGTQANIEGSKSTANWLLSEITDQPYIFEIAISKVTGRFLAMTSQGIDSELIISDDQITWTNLGHITDWSYVHVDYYEAGDKFLIRNGSGTDTPLISSPNGTDWTDVNVGLSADIYAIVNDPSLDFIAYIGAGYIDDGGHIITLKSTDAATWTAYITDLIMLPTTVIYAPEIGLFVGITEQPQPENICSSSNLTSWSQYINIADFICRKIAWSPTLLIFVVLGTISTTKSFLTSPDANTWTHIEFDFQGTIYDLIWCKNQKKFIVFVDGIIGKYTVESKNGLDWAIFQGKQYRDVINFRAAKAVKIAIQ